VRDLAKSRAPLFICLIFISSITVTVRFKVRVRVRVSKSRTASYLAMRHIWHDTGSELVDLGLNNLHNAVFSKDS